MGDWWVSSRKGKVAHWRTDGAACGRIVFHPDAYPDDGERRCARCTAAGAPDTPRLPYSVRERRRACDGAYGHRYRCDWGSGDLPAGWALGDIVRVPPEAFTDHFDGGWQPAGEFVVTWCGSYDEGDVFAYRLDGEGLLGHRVMWSCPTRSTWDLDQDLGALTTLVHTADPEGLAERERLLAAGWGVQHREVTVSERVRFGLPEGKP